MCVVSVQDDDIIPNCSICLEYQKIPRITKCGHSFWYVHRISIIIYIYYYQSEYTSYYVYYVNSWSCLLQHMSSSRSSAHKCPMCTEYIARKDLRSLKYVHTNDSTTTATTVVDTSTATDADISSALKGEYSESSPTPPQQSKAASTSIAYEGSFQLLYTYSGSLFPQLPTTCHNSTLSPYNNTKTSSKSSPISGLIPPYLGTKSALFSRYILSTTESARNLFITENQLLLYYYKKCVDSGHDMNTFITNANSNTNNNNTTNSSNSIHENTPPKSYAKTVQKSETDLNSTLSGQCKLLAYFSSMTIYDVEYIPYISEAIQLLEQCAIEHKVYINNNITDNSNSNSNTNTACIENTTNASNDTTSTAKSDTAVVALENISTSTNTMLPMKCGHISDLSSPIPTSGGGDLNPKIKPSSAPLTSTTSITTSADNNSSTSQLVPISLIDKHIYYQSSSGKHVYIHPLYVKCIVISAYLDVMLTHEKSIASSHSNSSNSNSNGDSNSINRDNINSNNGSSNRYKLDSNMIDILSPSVTQATAAAATVPADLTSPVPVCNIYPTADLPPTSPVPPQQPHKQPTSYKNNINNNKPTNNKHHHRDRANSTTSVDTTKSSKSVHSTSKNQHSATSEPSKNQHSATSEPSRNHYHRYLPEQLSYQHMINELLRLDIKYIHIPNTINITTTTTTTTNNNSSTTNTNNTTASTSTNNTGNNNSSVILHQEVIKIIGRKKDNGQMSKTRNFLRHLPENRLE